MSKMTQKEIDGFFGIKRAVPVKRKKYIKTQLQKDGTTKIWSSNRK